MKPQEFILALKKRLQQGLPGQSAHFKMLPIERRPVMKHLQGSPAPMASAVLILLYPNDGFVGTILIKRTEDLSVHSGQISFPGGKMEPDDYSIVQTALREAEEEIGIPPDKVEIIGTLSPLYVSPSNFEISPVIGFIRKPERYKPNVTEVSAVIELPLKQIESHRTQVDLIVREYTLSQVPCFSVNGHIIWGATAMILQELMDVLAEI
jgi:8-oxo-dGTP pyrophosphatase MutT (NUDIX family)